MKGFGRKKQTVRVDGNSLMKALCIYTLALNKATARLETHEGKPSPEIGQDLFSEAEQMFYDLYDVDPHNIQRLADGILASIPGAHASN